MFKESGRTRANIVLGLALAAFISLIINAILGRKTGSNMWLVVGMFSAVFLIALLLTYTVIRFGNRDPTRKWYDSNGFEFDPDDYDRDDW
jgi:uncharacterized membrane protein